VSMGDIDLDGFDEIAIGSWRHDDNRGSVMLFAGRTLDSEALRLDVADANWATFGAADNNYLGYRVRIEDLNDDEQPDLAVTGLQEELLDGTNNTGVVRIYDGQELSDSMATEPLGYDGSLDVPALEFAGLANGDFFGLSLASIGDRDEDGWQDWLVLAARDDTISYDVGRPYVVLSAEDSEVVALDLPGEASGARLGDSVTFIGDMNGDSRSEVVVSAPDTTVPNTTFLGGIVHLYMSTTAGVESEPTQSLYSYTGYGYNDGFGAAVAAAGDFNNDTFADLAIVADSDEQPGSFGSAYANPDDCPNSKTNQGSVFVFLGEEGGALSSQPAFVVYNSKQNAYMETLMGGLDVNGDGYDDLLAGSTLYDLTENNVGTVSVIFGQDADPAGNITVICPSETTNWTGVNSGDNLGQALSALGNIDPTPDTCDDFVMSAPGFDTTTDDVGGLLIVHGWGATGCPSEPTAQFMVGFLEDSAFGTSLASGLDADGDGEPDILVGAPGSNTGYAALLQASVLASIATQPLPAGVMPAYSSGYWELFAYKPEYIWIGAEDDAQFGSTVVLVPDVDGDNIAEVGVAEHSGTWSGASGTGSLGLFFSSGNGDMFWPDRVILSETSSNTNEFAASVQAAPSSPTTLLIGAPSSDAHSVDYGATYLLELEP
jgi:hypothetical protein